MAITVQRNQRWQDLAEELVRQVHNLLDHGDALEKALRKSLGKQEARSRLRQLENLLEALEIEMWRAASPPEKTIVAAIATGLGKTLGVVGLTITGLVTADVYQTATTAENLAGKVLECIVETDTTDADADAGLDQPIPVPDPPDFDIVLRGYERTQVDSYIERLLEGARNGRRLGFVGVPDFTVVLRGYERTQVDSYLESLSPSLTSLPDQPS